MTGAALPHVGSILRRSYGPDMRCAVLAVLCLGLLGCSDTEPLSHDQVSDIAADAAASVIEELEARLSEE